jgi:hypothetical protein
MNKGLLQKIYFVLRFRCVSKWTRKLRNQYYKLQGMRVGTEPIRLKFL